MARPRGRLIRAVPLSRRAALCGLMLLPINGCAREKRGQEASETPQGVAPQRQKLDSGLVELVTLDPDIRLDIRYATPQNFTGKILYKQARAFLQPVAAQALLRAHLRLKNAGFGLTIFDAYRPLAITKYMWRITPPDKRNYVANPKKGSRHNRGCAVDLTLYDLKTGKQVEMPSPYDDFSARAHQGFMDASATAIANRERLLNAMQAEGFYAMSNEWWHFDYKDWADYPIMDVAFDRL
jgi:zinc D-Ala-D-Ala dipeptidase